MKLSVLVLKSTKFDKVVNREVCRISSKGTKVCSFIDGNTVDAHNNYLIAICEKVSWHEFGEFN